MPGFGLEELGSPHLATFAAPAGPLERAVAGREREFLTAFIGDPAVARSGSRDEAVRAYSRPGRMTAAFAQYRALPQDGEDNRHQAVPPLTTPTLALSGGAPARTVVSLRRVARNVRSVVIPGAGHYVQEDRPAEVAAALAAFLHDQIPALRHVLLGLRPARAGSQHRTPRPRRCSPRATTGT